MIKEYNEKVLKLSESAVKEVYKDLDIPLVDIQGRKIVKADIENKKKVK